MRQLGWSRRKNIGTMVLFIVVVTTVIPLYTVLVTKGSSTHVVVYQNHVDNRVDITVDVQDKNWTRPSLKDPSPPGVPPDKCEHWFKPSFEENLKVISNYPLDNVEEYLQKIDKNMTQPNQMMTQFPVIVTAASSNFYSVSQGLLKSIHTWLIPKYGDIKIIYYDLGLTETQNLSLRKYCKCEVRKFEFDDFPEHVRQLKTYTWKPIIIKTLLMEYGWVWWMDSSVRFVSDDLDLPLKYSRDNSFLFFTYAVSLSVAQRTDRRTMAFLGEDVCKFRHFGMIEATFTLYYFNHVTKSLINKWVACALKKDCMAPSNAGLSCSTSKKSDGHCHRYDQAVLSIMLRRLYHDGNDYPLVETPFRIHRIRRGERIAYFNEK